MERILWAPHTAGARRQQLETSPELMTTYRKGTKWLRPELIGQRVELFDEKTQTVFGTAEVLSVKACLFKDIDASDHARQSSEMTVDQRLAVMQKAYGEYDDNTLTTVLTLGYMISSE